MPRKARQKSESGIYNIKSVMIQNETKEIKKKILKEILEIEGVSTRQLARITGISPNIIWTL